MHKVAPASEFRRPAYSCGKWMVTFLDRFIPPNLLPWVKSPFFHIFELILLVVDAAIIGWQCECYSRYIECKKELVLLINYSHYVLTAIFIIIAILTIIAYRGQIRKHAFQIFDKLAILLFCVIGLVLFLILGDEVGSTYVSAATFLFKFARIVRLVYFMGYTSELRAYELLRDLHMLARGLHSSIATLVSTVSCLFLLCFMFGVNLCAYMGLQEKGGRRAIEVENQLAHFNSVWGCMNTLFRFLFLDDVNDIVAPLSRDQELAWFIIVAFMFLSVFLIINLIVAVIVRQAMAFITNDREYQAKELKIKRQNYTKKMIGFFNKIDEDGDRFLTLHEFEQAFTNQEIRNDLLSAGVELHDLRELFCILDTTDKGVLAMSDFVSGLKRIRGAITAYDLVLVMHLARTIRRRLNTMKDFYKWCLQRVEGSRKTSLQIQTQLKKTTTDLGACGILTNKIAKSLHVTRSVTINGVHGNVPCQIDMSILKRQGSQ